MTSDDNLHNLMNILSGNISNITMINYADPNFSSSQGREKQNVKMWTKYVVEGMSSITRI